MLSQTFAGGLGSHFGDRTPPRAAPAGSPAVAGWGSRRLCRPGEGGTPSYKGLVARPRSPTVSRTNLWIGTLGDLQ
jgi:hypothetical protein